MSKIIPDTGLPYLSRGDRIIMSMRRDSERDRAEKDVLRKAKYEDEQTRTINRDTTLRNLAIVQDDFDKGLTDLNQLNYAKELADTAQNAYTNIIMRAKYHEPGVIADATDFLYRQARRPRPVRFQTPDSNRKFKEKFPNSFYPLPTDILGPRLSTPEYIEREQRRATVKNSATRGGKTRRDKGRKTRTRKSGGRKTHNRKRR